MLDRPFFSIILPTYNRENMIGKAVESVITQSYSDWELIIIDDGSKDGSKSVVEQFKDSRIQYFYQSNQGRSVARNVGIEKAKGMFICFLDSDDYYLRHHLSTLKESITRNKKRAALYYTGAISATENTREEMPVFDHGLNKMECLLAGSIMINSVCVSAGILADHKFPAICETWEDMHLWFRILSLYPFIQIPVYTTVVYSHNERSYIQFINSEKKETHLQHIKCIKQLFYSADFDVSVSESKKKLYLYNEYRKIIKQLIQQQHFMMSNALSAHALKDLLFTKYNFGCLKWLGYSFSQMCLSIFR